MAEYIFFGIWGTFWQHYQKTYCTTEGGSISESFSLWLLSLPNLCQTTPLSIFSPKELKGMIWHLFWRCERFSEIKPTLVLDFVLITYLINYLGKPVEKKINITSVTDIAPSMSCLFASTTRIAFFNSSS